MEDIKTVYHSLGTFDIVCGQMHISDPCYKKDEKYGPKTINVKSGNWLAFQYIEEFTYEEEVTDWPTTYERYFKILKETGVEDMVLSHKKVPVTTKTPKNIFLFHSDYSKLTGSCYEKLDKSIGVDSGKVGFFDYSQYPDVPGEYKDKESFYRRMCDLGKERFSNEGITFYNSLGKTFEFGAVTRTYGGDGSYSCFVHRNDDKEIIALSMDFIPHALEDE